MWVSSISKFNLIKTRLQTFSKRKLYTSTRNSPEVVIGNNAALFAILDVTKRLGRREHLSLIYPKFWLDDVHQDHLNNNWGQRVYSLPEISKNLFKDIYPNHADDSYIKWGQFQQLRQFVLEEIKKDYPVYEGEPLSIDLNLNGGYLINLLTGNQEQTIKVNANAHFFNWYRVPKKHGFPDLIKMSHTELYSLPKSHVPHKVILFGQGESIVWLVRDFPNTTFASIKREGDRLPTVRDNPSYQGIDLSRLMVFEIEDPRVLFQPIEEEGNKASKKVLIIYSDEGGSKKSFEGYIYTAIGLAAIAGLTKNVPEGSKTDLSMEIVGWVASKEVPGGSLLQSFTQLMEKTKNLNWIDRVLPVTAV